MLKGLMNILRKYQGVILYLIFGALTTAVNYIVYLPLYNKLNFSATVSNSVAWVVAVLVAFVTNKAFVFKSYDWSPKTVFSEFAKFVGCRAGSGIAETGILFVAVDLLQFDGNIIKILTSIFVIVLNYFFSKLLIFKKNNE